MLVTTRRRGYVYCVPAAVKELKLRHLGWNEEVGFRIDSAVICEGAHHHSSL